MGLLDGLLGGLMGGGTPGAAQQGQSPLMMMALQLIQQNGGLPGIISKLQNGGMGQQVGSWVGTGQNAPVSGSQLSEVLGSGSIGQIRATARHVAWRSEFGPGANAAADHRPYDAARPGTRRPQRHAGAGTLGAHRKAARLVSAAIQ